MFHAIKFTKYHGLSSSFMMAANGKKIFTYLHLVITLLLFCTLEKSWPMWATTIYYKCGITVCDFYCNCRPVTENENKCRKSKLHMKGRSYCRIIWFITRCTFCEWIRYFKRYKFDLWFGDNLKRFISIVALKNQYHPWYSYTKLSIEDYTDMTHKGR